MATYGEVSWNDETNNSRQKQGSNRDSWLRLEKGDNKIRLVTTPFQYLMHKYKAEGDKGFGQKVMCSAVHGNCPLCQLGDKPKRRWFLGVIDRKTKTYKVLDIGYGVFVGIQTLVKDSDWGNPLGYDINIKCNPLNPPAQYYIVTPCNKEAMSSEDQALKDSADLEELKRKVTPPTPDLVQKRLDKLNGVTSTEPAKTASKEEKPAPSKVDLSADDDDFADYDSAQ